MAEACRDTGSLPWWPLTVSPGTALGSTDAYQDLTDLPLTRCGTVKLLTLSSQIINFHYYHLLFFLKIVLCLWL